MGFHYILNPPRTNLNIEILHGASLTTILLRITKGTYQNVQMRRLVCTFVDHMQQIQVFSHIYTLLF